MCDELRQVELANRGLSHEWLDAPFTVGEVDSAIREAASGTAPGPDGLPIAFIKHGGLELRKALATLFTAVLNQCTPEGEGWPERWCLGLVTLLHKGGPRDRVANYREITLLAVLSKLLESLIHRRLDAWAEACGMIQDEQGGFRSGRRTEDQSFILYETLQQRRSLGKQTYATFLDIRTAYDSVFRERLLTILHENGVFGKVWNVMRAMFSVLRRRVRVGGDWSHEFTLDAGLPQGSVLSPWCYKMYINGLIRFLRTVDNGIIIASRKLSSLWFADDASTLAATGRAAQQHLDIAAMHARTNGYEFNVPKSAILLVGKRSQEDEKQQWLLNGEQLVRRHEYKYLGAEQGERSGWRSAIERSIDRAERAVCILRGRGCVRAALSAAVSRNLFMALVRPILEFACTLWSLTKAQEARFESIQTKFARAALGLPSRSSNWCTLMEIGLCPLWSRRDKLCLRFWRYLCSQSSDRILSAVFRERCNAVDSGAKDAAGSILVKYKALLNKYGLGAQWRARSTLGVDWDTLVEQKVAAKVEQQLEEDARSSQTTRVYMRRAPGLYVPVWLSSDRNPPGQWLKCRARTGTLPLLSVLGRWANPEWSAEQKLCPCCQSQEETLEHFLRCPHYSAHRTRMLDECRSKLSGYSEAVHERTLVLAALTGSNLTAADDVLLGSPCVGEEDLSVETVLALHAVCCDFLLVCWKSRCAFLGGSPSIGKDGAKVLVPGTWRLLSKEF